MNTPLIVTVEFDTAAAQAVLDALEYTMRQRGGSAGEEASMQRAYDDLMLAMLEN